MVLAYTGGPCGKGDLLMDIVKYFYLAVVGQSVVFTTILSLHHTNPKVRKINKISCQNAHKFVS